MTADSPPLGRLERALVSLRGLAVGDALGSQFFVPSNYPSLKRRELPEGPWRWTDDTEMACSVVAVLAAHQRIDQDALARSFADHHDVGRGYGRGAGRLLSLVREGEDWREPAAALFHGQGSWGSGAAMRIAPLGAWYADAPEQATHQAEISACPTHQHREAVAGSIAVAAAAALAGSPDGPPSPETLLDGVIALVPKSAVGQGLRRARDMLDYDDVVTVAAVLGCGRRRTAHDTVPFALWSAARSLGDFEGAFWATAQVGGDVDTTCAIMGGVLASGKAGDTARRVGGAHGGAARLGAQGTLTAASQVIRGSPCPPGALRDRPLLSVDAAGGRVHPAGTAWDSWQRLAECFRRVPP